MAQRAHGPGSTITDRLEQGRLGALGGALGGPLGWLATLGVVGAALGVLGACSVDATQPSVDNEDVTASVAQQTASLGRAPTPQRQARQSVHRYVVLSEAAAVASLPATMRAGSKVAKQLLARQLKRIDAQQKQVQPQLEALGAKVIGRFRKLGNAFHVRMDAAREAELRRINGVTSVQEVPRFERNLATALPYVGVPEAWERLGSLHGAGVRIGIVDTGLDYNHAGLGGDGNVATYQANDPTQIEAGSFPTSKVAGGYDFAGDSYDAGSNTLDVPSPDPDPLDCRTESQNGYSGGHGSHVGGIAGGNGVLTNGSGFYGPYNQSLNPQDFSVFPGVAPEATLYALKVFGCDGSTNLVFQALEWASDPNQDDNLDDRLDVVNASLGASFGAYSPFTASVVKNLHKLGGIFVASAGNDGNTLFITGQPATIPHALSVANANDSPYMTVATVEPANIIEDLPGYEASFTRSLRDTGSIEARLQATEPRELCSDAENAAALAGAIALIDRGSCQFASKVGRAESAGAIAAIVINNDLNGAPFAMTSQSVTANIPAVMIRYADGQRLREQLDKELRIRLSHTQYQGLGTGTMSGSSSRGPSAMLPILKPEITGPGSGILSVQVGSGSAAAFKSGTSMSGPAIAGAAALLRQARPEADVDTIKALLMNSSRDVLAADGTVEPVSRQGAGYMNLAASVEQSLSLRSNSEDGSIAVNFGSLVASVASETSAEVRIDNHGDQTATASLSASLKHPLPGVTVSVEPTTVEVAAGQSELVKLKLQLDPSALGRPAAGPLTATAEEGLPSWWFHEAGGFLQLTPPTESGATSLRLPFFGVVRAASNTQVADVRTCDDGDGALTAGRYSLSLNTADSAHPSPTVSVFELAALDDANPLSDSDPVYARGDLRAVGISYTPSDGPNEAMVYVAAAMQGDWITPSFSSQSVVNILIDSDDDTNADFFVRSETFEDSAVFATQVYDLETGEPIGRQHYLNALPATEADTALLHNSVIVLPFYASDVGLDEDKTSFRYRVSIASPFIDDLNERTEWLEYDTAKANLDTSRFAPRKGEPFFKDLQSFDVWLTDAGVAASATQLLVMHHNAATPGQRWQVVDLSERKQEEVVLDIVNKREGIGPHVLAAAEIHVKNPGDAIVKQLQLRASIENASWSLFTPPPGFSCKRTESATVLDCSVSELKAGETAKMAVQYKTQQSDAVIQLATRSALGCESEKTLEVSVKAAEEPVPLRSSGGCACTMQRPRQPLPTRGWLLALTGALAIVRRRRIRRLSFK